MAKLMLTTSATASEEALKLRYYDGQNDLAFGETLPGVARIPRDYRIDGAARGSGSGRYYPLAPHLTQRVAGGLFNACTGFATRVNLPAGSTFRRGSSPQKTPAGFGEFTPVDFLPNRLYTTAVFAVGTWAATFYFRAAV